MAMLHLNASHCTSTHCNGDMRTSQPAFSGRCIPKAPSTTAAAQPESSVWCRLSVPPTSNTPLLCGLFKANEPGAAQKIFDEFKCQLASKWNKREDPEQCVLDSANECEPLWGSDRSFVGCAAVLHSDCLTYVVIGRGLIAMGRSNANEQQGTDIVAAPSEDSNDCLLDESLRLADGASPRQFAFGSLIAVDRRDGASGARCPEIQSGCLPLCSAHSCLVMAADPSGRELSPEAVCSKLRDWGAHQSPAGQSGSLEALSGLPESLFYATSCELTTARTVQYESHVLGADQSAHSRSSQATSSGHGDRRVSFADSQEPENPFAEETAQRLPWGIHGMESIEDLAVRLSGASHLDAPSMTIPEENAIPSESLAGKLPPPLLAPIRKAYPSGEWNSLSGEWTITADMLSSPSPDRKAMIGMAASVNSPDGLWRPGQSKHDESPSNKLWKLMGRASNPHTDHSLLGGIENERVRGGLPRPGSSSYLCQMGANSPSPRGSPSSSPSCLNDLLSASLHSIGSSFQDSEPKESHSVQEPWNAPVSPLGRKMRGRSTALKMLRSNDEARMRDLQKSLSAKGLPSSAPAGLLVDDKDRRLSDESTGTLSLSQTSSHTDGLSTTDGLSRQTSVNSSNASRTVNCLVPLQDVANQGGKTTQSTPTATCFPQASLPIRASVWDPEPGRLPSTTSYAHEELLQPLLRGRGCAPIPTGGRRSTADSAGEDSLEGRQHSGMAYSKSAADVHLADSVRSLTLAGS